MEIPYEVTPRRDTGLYNAKIGIWLFLASEVMLFGGLFSAYVFLRVGAQPGDNPWPLGTNVQWVWAGFTNTLVLIASSVFVVFSWVAIKERKWHVFQRWMIAVLACAGLFMVIKFFEYRSKLTQHHDIRLADNSLLGGKILNGSDKIRFNAKKVTVDFTTGIPGFMTQIQGDSNIEFKIEGRKGGETVKLSQFKGWFMKQRRRVARELAAERAKRRENTWDAEKDKPTVTTATLVADFVLHVNPRKIVGYDQEKVNYRDRTSVAGALQKDGDVIEFELHKVNLQMVPLQEQDDVIAWQVIREATHNDHIKDNLLAIRDEKINLLRESYENGAVPFKVLRGPLVNFHNIHEVPKAGEAAHSGDAEAGEGGDHGGHEIILRIPRDQTSFVTNHGPRAGTYYAIYFTMTGLHGLHVIGGALVLAYFLFFGKKLFLKNPEHLANRVEVGGLFWHFVDLIWIFLFPVMYLM